MLPHNNRMSLWPGNPSVSRFKMLYVVCVCVCAAIKSSHTSSKARLPWQSEWNYFRNNYFCADVTKGSNE